MTKVFKKISNRIGKLVENYWNDSSDYFEEISEEASDFFKNYFKPSKREKSSLKKNQIKVYGFMEQVRPAYIFAERVDNVLKILFSISMIVSALITSFWGFVKLSQLLEYLIDSLPGRILILVIGVCYMLIAVWKIIHLRSGQRQ